MIDSANHRWIAPCALALGLALLAGNGAQSAKLSSHAVPLSVSQALAPQTAVLSVSPVREYRMPLTDPRADALIPEAGDLHDGAVPGHRRRLRKCLANRADENWPPNPTIGVSLTQSLVAAGGHIGLYARRIGRRQRNCSLVSLVTPSQFFAPVLQSGDFPFDPVVTFDRINHRFIVTANSFPSGSTQHLYIAAAKVNDAGDQGFNEVVAALPDLSGSTFQSLTMGLATAPDKGRALITGNVVPAISDATSGAVDVDSRALENGASPGIAFLKLIQGSDSVPVSQGITTDGELIGALLVAFGGKQSKAVPSVLSGSTTLERYSVTFGAAPAQDTLARTHAITVPAWSPPPNATQPNGQNLLTGDGSFSSPGVQIGNKFWLVHTVNDGGFARPEVYELSATKNQPVAVFHLSSVPEQNDHLFNASIAVNGAGPKARAFVNASRTIPSGGTAGRPAFVILDGPVNSSAGWITNVLETSPTQFKTGNTGQNCNDLTGLNACRWGASSSIQIDPASNRTVWGINELAGKEQLGGPNTEFDWDTAAGELAQ